MNKPRTPRYFPKMTVRGARRRRLAPFQRMTGVFDRLSISAAQAAENVTKLFALLKEEN